MNIAAFQHWCAKPRNGGFSYEESKLKFDQECASPTAISDLLGPTPKLARRVAIRVRDTITMRDQTERSRTAPEANSVDTGLPKI